MNNNILLYRKYFWILTLSNLIVFGYSDCPFMKKALQKSIRLYEIENELKYALHNDDFIVPVGTPGAGTWNDDDITNFQKQIIRNASIGLFAGQLYSQTVLMKSEGPQLSRLERLAKIKEQSNCIPEEYRCRLLNKPCDQNAPYQALDGTCNNLILPALGSTFTPYNRWVDAVYNDGLYEIRRNSLTTEPLPSPRLIGNYLYNKSSYTESPLRIANVNGLFFGQYIAHDMSIHLTYQVGEDYSLMRCCSADYTIRLPRNLMSTGCHPIDIPTNDEYYSQYNMTCMEFVRLAPTFPRECKLGVIEQGNTVTSYIDKSVIYGSSKQLTDILRTMINGTMKFNKYGNFPTEANCQYHDWRCYNTGVITGTQSLMLSSVILTNLHFHNYLAQNLAIINPHWNDEKLFQEARRLFIAINQHYVYDEWIPLFVGDELNEYYAKNCQKTWPYCNFYNEKMDGSTLSDMIHGAMRLFHQLVPSEIEFMNSSNKIYATMPLRSVILEPGFLNHQFPDVLRGMLYQPLNVFNTYSSDMRNHIFNIYQKNGIGIDESSLDILRGRDMGVPPYYQYMELCNSVTVSDWADLEPNLRPENIEKAKNMYGSVFDMDLITGIFLERKTNYMGPVAKCLIIEQFKRSRIGDRYYYTNEHRPNPFTREQLHEINKYNYAKMICSMGDLEEVPENSFEIPSETNPMVRCNSLEQINLNLWKEDSVRSD